MAICEIARAEPVAGGDVSTDAYGRDESRMAAARRWAADQGHRLTFAVARLVDRAQRDGLSGTAAMQMECGLARLRETGAPIDVAFDASARVGEIRYRLHPLDVGFDLRGERIATEVDVSAPTIRVSYARRRDGERRVIEGPTATVLALLRREGYRFREIGAPAAPATAPIDGPDRRTRRRVDPPRRGRRRAVPGDARP